MEQYGKMALIYDKMINIDYNKWIDFLEKYFNAKGVDIKYKKALELGCGTGNMTIKLKEKGLDVVAIDLSKDMLTIADEKLRNKRYKAMLLNQNMTSFDIPKKFDFVFSFCDGYNYIIEEQDIIKSFERVYSGLNNNGYFIFDISTPYKLREIIGNNTFTLNEEELSYIWDNYLDNDTIEMYITFFLQCGKLYERFTEIHLQKIYEIDYIIGLLKKAGFSKVEIFDDYNLNNKIMKPEDITKIKSTRVTFTALKEEF